MLCLFPFLEGRPLDYDYSERKPASEITTANSTTLTLWASQMVGRLRAHCRQFPQLRMKGTATRSPTCQDRVRVA